VTSGSVWHTQSTDRNAWSFVVARSFLATVNAGASNAAIAGLWSRADSPSVAIEELVGAIPLLETHGVHSFALVSFTDGDDQTADDRAVTAVVRGAAVVDLFSVGGSRRFSAGGMEPWMLADFRSVTAVVMGGDDEVTAPVAQLRSGGLPLTRGVVQATRLLWSLAPVEFGDGDRRSGESEAGVRPTELPSRSDPLATPQTEPLAEPHAEPVAEPPAASVDDPDATIVTPRGHPPAWVDDETVLLSHRGSRSAPARTAPAERAERARDFRYRLSDGQPQALDAPTIFGRNPSAPRVVAGRTPHLITVSSPDAAVSASHLRLVAEGGAVVATDLRSTNGTLVTPRGGKRRRLRPGESLVVLPGTRIDIGDGNIIEIMSTELAPSAAQTPEPGRGPA